MVIQWDLMEKIWFSMGIRWKILGEVMEKMNGKNLRNIWGKWCASCVFFEQSVFQRMLGNLTGKERVESANHPRDSGITCFFFSGIKWWNKVLPGTPTGLNKKQIWDLTRPSNHVLCFLGNLTLSQSIWANHTAILPIPLSINTNHHDWQISNLPGLICP